MLLGQFLFIDAVDRLRDVQGLVNGGSRDLDALQIVGVHGHVAVRLKHCDFSVIASCFDANTNHYH